MPEELHWPAEVPKTDPPYEIEVMVMMKYRPRQSVVRLPGLGSGKIRTMRRKTDGIWYCQTTFKVPNIQLAIARLDYRFQILSSASIH